jgi:Contractile injection system tube protein
MALFFDQLQALATKKPHHKTPFGHAMARFRIGSVDDPKLHVAAQYNPREIAITQPIGWAVHEPVRKQTNDEMYQEFVGTKPQTVQVELLFDFENSKHSVMEQVAKLKKLAAVRDPHSTEKDLCRPHFCVATWSERAPDSSGHDPDGERHGDMPALRCVIDSLATKYQMFSSTGQVMRATCTVSLREANLLGLAKGPNNARIGRGGRP